MKKFLVLYKAPTSAFEQMQKSTPEQQKAGMDAWMAWGKKAGPSIIDMGAPLGKSLRVTKGGASPVTNDLGGFSILQAESKEALAETLKGHPHFMMPDGFDRDRRVHADAGYVTRRRPARRGRPHAQQNQPDARGALTRSPACRNRPRPRRPPSRNNPEGSPRRSRSSLRGTSRSHSHRRSSDRAGTSRTAAGRSALRNTGSQVRTDRRPCTPPCSTPAPFRSSTRASVRRCDRRLRCTRSPWCNAGRARMFPGTVDPGEPGSTSGRCIRCPSGTASRARRRTRRRDHWERRSPRRSGVRCTRIRRTPDSRSRRSTESPRRSRCSCRRRIGPSSSMDCPPLARRQGIRPPSRRRWRCHPEASHRWCRRRPLASRPHRRRRLHRRCYCRSTRSRRARSRRPRRRTRRSVLSWAPPWRRE